MLDHSPNCKTHTFLSLSTTSTSTSAATLTSAFDDLIDPVWKDSQTVPKRTQKKQQSSSHKGEGKDVRGFDDTCAALEIYRMLYGEQRIKQKFVIPSHSEEWPESLWGMNLGRRLNNLRCSLCTDRSTSSAGINMDDPRIETLVKRGLWDMLGLGVKLVNTSIDIDSFIDCIHLYNDQHHNFNVPISWRVPRHDPWPRGAWGFSLGAATKAFKAGKLYNDTASKMRIAASGVVFDRRDRRSFNTTLSALKHYCFLYGNYSIPVKFVIPKSNYHDHNDDLPNLAVHSNDYSATGLFTGSITSDCPSLSSNSFYLSNKSDHSHHHPQPYHMTSAMTVFNDHDADNGQECSWHWPAETLGMRLGDLARHLRRKCRENTLPNYQLVALEQIGFKTDAGIAQLLDLRGFNVTVSALSAFKTVYRHAIVPQAFVVPRTGPWPQSTWGLRLGVRVYNLRCKTNHSRLSVTKLAQLNELGVPLDSTKDTRRFDSTYKALVVHKEVFGTAVVASDFVVPQEEPWPDDVWDLRLGQRLKQIRLKNVNITSEQADMLTDLGFRWYRRPFDRRRFPYIRRALLTHKRLKGHLDVKYLFRVPFNSSRWEEDLWGLRLGRRVHHMRKEGSYRMFHDELTAMGFLWDLELKRRFALNRRRRRSRGESGVLIWTRRMTLPLWRRGRRVA